MELVAFNAVCPFEIGDKVVIGALNKQAIIIDIACVHYVKDNRIEFLYQLDHDEKYHKMEIEGIRSKNEGGT